MNKFVLVIIIALTVLIVSLGSSHAAVRIYDDRGGRIGYYVDKFSTMKKQDKSVVIDGLCASACTLLLGILPHNKICITQNASLGFHAASDPESGNIDHPGKMIINPVATNMMFYMYPSKVRHWITRHGGLKVDMIFLYGQELQGMFRHC
jgi:hypothetical protein